MSLFVAKTVMFPFIVGALIFFLKRVQREQREKNLVEKYVRFLNNDKKSLDGDIFEHS